jgi:hypothetical protein
LGRGFNAQGAWAYALHRNALAMHRRVIPNPRRLNGGPSTERWLCSAQGEPQDLASAGTKDGQQHKEKLSVGFSLRIDGELPPIANGDEIRAEAEHSAKGKSGGGERNQRLLT